MEELGAGRWVGVARDVGCGSLDAGLIFKDLFLCERSQRAADVSWGPGGRFYDNKHSHSEGEGLFPLCVQKLEGKEALCAEKVGSSIPSLTPTPFSSSA